MGILITPQTEIAKDLVAWGGSGRVAMQGIEIISFSVCQRRDGLEDHSLHLALTKPLGTALSEPEDLLRAGQVAAVNQIVRLFRVQYPELEAVLVLRLVSQPVHKQVQSPRLSLHT